MRGRCSHQNTRGKWGGWEVGGEVVDMNECFICCEASGSLYRVCKCDTFVHEACMRRLVSVPTHSTHCAVCRTPYNVRQRTRCVVSYQPIVWVICASWLSAGILSLLFLFPETAADRSILTGAIVGLSANGVLCWMFECRRNAVTLCGVAVGLERHTVAVRLSECMLAPPPPV